MNVIMKIYNSHLHFVETVVDQQKGYNHPDLAVPHLSD